MKIIQCEMCGSNELVKQNGVYVCQMCGTQYTLEEAKKLMVEGTVKIDNSEKLNNLYILARQARESNDAENAVKYYDLIKQEDPKSWEAMFYNVYYRAAQTRIFAIASAASSVTDCLPQVFELIKSSSSAMDEKKMAVGEITLRFTQLMFLLEKNARNTYKSSFDSIDDSSYKMKYFREYASRADAVYIGFLFLGDTIEKDYSDDTDMQKMAITSWKNGIQLYMDYVNFYDDRVQKIKAIDNAYGTKVRKYEPTYTLPEPNYDGYPNIFVEVMKKFQNQNSTTGSGGCYVATSVYGSYNCPQVWTLRRYRDYTLSQTWYGRTFIRTYYAISPTLVKWFGKTRWFKKMWRGKLDRMVSKLQAKGYESTPYEDRDWKKKR